MLGRLFKVRLRAAEAALAEGRLDEAFRLATAPDLASDSQAREVLTQLGDLLFRRAEEHFKAARCTEALLDLDRAERAGVKSVRVSDLRAIVRTAADHAHQEQESRLGRLDAAQQRLAEGSLRAAEQILARASATDLDAHRLLKEAGDREKRAEELFAEVQHYLDARHMAVAVERFRRAKQLHPKARQVAECERALVEQVIVAVEQALREGRLHRANEEMNLLNGIGEEHTAKAEVATVLDVISAAGAAISARDYAEARRKVLGLEHLLPEGRWVRQVSEQLKNIDELTTQLHGGPLGSWGAVAGGRRHWKAQAAEGGRPKARNAHLAGLRQTLPVTDRSSADGFLPQELLVLVDGSGSYLLIRKPRASIGRAAASAPPDIPIISDLSERHAEVARVDDDYFIFAGREVNIGGNIVQQKLLQDGDKIILGKRARLTFKLPSRKSTSAVMDLSGSSKLPHDVKRVILFDRLATVGRHTTSHIVAPTASEDLVLYERGGSLWIRHKANGRGDSGIAVQVGTPFEYSGVSMVIEPWEVKS